jgi:hypothetical protein
MNLANVVLTPNPQNPADYNVKADITNDQNEKIGDFGVDGIDVFTWWVAQDVEFQVNIVNQFMWIMAQEIMSGNAE